METTQETRIVVTYWISTGEKTAQYTLWRDRVVNGFVSPFVKVNHFIKNLGNDPERALQYANDYIDSVEGRNEDRDDYVIIRDLDTGFGLNKYGEGLASRDRYSMMLIERGYFPFGKHEGSPIATAPSHYIMWWGDQPEDEKKPVIKALVQACRAVDQEKGYSKDAQEKRAIKEAEWAEAKLNSKHIGEVGKRQRFQMKVEFIKAFDTQFGTSYVQKGRDADGNYITYFGGSDLGQVGDTVHFDAKVKTHDEYQDTKQTIVQRPTKIELLQTVKK